MYDDDTMARIRKQSRAGRPTSGNIAKKVVSLTIDPAIIERVDAYAADKRISRSAAIEAAIIGLFTLNSKITATENSLVQYDDCIFSTPSIGTAIFY
jgi:hypothetical protein